MILCLQRAEIVLIHHHSLPDFNSFCLKDLSPLGSSLEGSLEPLTVLTGRVDTSLITSEALKFFHETVLLSR